MEKQKEKISLKNEKKLYWRWDGKVFINLIKRRNKEIELLIKKWK